MQRTAVSTRFWLGNALPALVLVLLLAFTVIVVGRGRESAPLVALAASFAAVPATMLVNSWGLFVAWRSRIALFLGGLIVPLLVASGMILYVDGTGSLRQAGESFLAPFLAILRAVSPRPFAALALWILVMIGLLLAARSVDARRTDAR